MRLLYVPVFFLALLGEESVRTVLYSIIVNPYVEYLVSNQQKVRQHESSSSRYYFIIINVRIYLLGIPTGTYYRYIQYSSRYILGRRTPYIFL